MHSKGVIGRAGVLQIHENVNAHHIYRNYSSKNFYEGKSMDRSSCAWNFALQCCKYCWLMYDRMLLMFFSCKPLWVKTPAKWLNGIGVRNNTQSAGHCHIINADSLFYVFYRHFVVSWLLRGYMHKYATEWTWNIELSRNEIKIWGFCGRKKAKILMTQVALVGVSKLLSNQKLSRMRIPLPLYTT